MANILTWFLLLMRNPGIGLNGVLELSVQFGYSNNPSTELLDMA